jgi:hypothetical protein
MDAPAPIPARVLRPLLVFGLPALVLLVGGAVVTATRSALRQEQEVALRRHFAASARLVGAVVDYTLARAPRLAVRFGQRAAAWDNLADDPAPLAGIAGDLLAGVSLVDRLAWATEDGVIWEAVRDEHGVRLLERAGGERPLRALRLDRDGSLRPEPLRNEDSTWSPRLAGPLVAARSATTAVWVGPHRLLLGEGQGLSSAWAQRDERGHLRGVAVATCSTALLALRLSRLELPDGAGIAVLDSGGNILARSGVDSADSAELLSRVVPQLPGVQAGQEAVRLYSVGGNLVYLRRLEEAGTPWIVAVHGPAPRESQLPGVAAAVVLVLSALAAALVGWLLARRLGDTQRRLAEADNRLRDLGAYSLLHPIGGGGMGEVWRAEHRQLRRAVAIKLVRLRGHDEERRLARARFEREAQVTAALANPHTVAVYDFGETEDGDFYYVMELLDGVDLGTLVAQHGPQPAGRVVRILQQACRSLAEAHAAGLIHRDIKPANLVLCRLGGDIDVVKVLDFGICQIVRDDAPQAPRLTRAGLVNGTPSFMAPEQALDEACDGRADLYALACVAWYLLTGRPLFEGEDDPMRQMLDHISRPLPDFAQLCPTAPPELLEIVRDCLAKSRYARPADAETLSTRLATVVCSGDQSWDEARARSWWAGLVAPAAPASTPDGHSATRRVRVRRETETGW